MNLLQSSGNQSTSQRLPIVSLKVLIDRLRDQEAKLCMAKEDFSLNKF